MRSKAASFRLVRSLIGPGAIVRKGEEVVDRVLVGSPGRGGDLRDVRW